MPSGNKPSYTAKQIRQADHIEENYEQKGVSKKEAGARAWATDNKLSGGGKKSDLGERKVRDKIEYAPVQPNQGSNQIQR